MILDGTDQGGNWTPHDEGQWQAICIDVIEKYGVETKWGAKNKVGLVFLTDAPYRDNEPQTCAAWHTASMHEKANLRKFVRSWIGKDLTAKQLAAFDTEKLIGMKATVQVVHNESDGITYANIDAIMKAAKDNKLEVPTDYERYRNRQKDDGPDYEKVPAAIEETEDDLPF